jgi:hypothetical protein
MRIPSIQGGMVSQSIFFHTRFVFPRIVEQGTQDLTFVACHRRSYVRYQVSDVLEPNRAGGRHCDFPILTMLRLQGFSMSCHTCSTSHKTHETRPSKYRQPHRTTYADLGCLRVAKLSYVMRAPFMHDCSHRCSVQSKTSRLPPA